MTKIPHDGSENDRFRDAVDLLLLKDLLATEELPSVRRACEDTFHIQAEHAWPPEIVLPKHWRDPFKSMAQSVGLSITSIDDAETERRALLDSILNATSTWPRRAGERTRRDSQRKQIRCRSFTDL